MGVNTHLCGQGEISVDNTGASAEQKVYIDEWLNPAALAPGGRQFLVALYFSPVDGDESSLTQAGDVVGFLGNPDQRYGVFLGGGRTVATLQIGGPGFFQVKGWEASYGSTYEEAVTNPAARTGKSEIFIADTANRITSSEAVYGLVHNSYPDRPFRGFVIAVPEPSTTVFALTAVALVLVVPRAQFGTRKAPSRQG